MNKIIWLIKQLFPLDYNSTFTENGIRKISTFKMWFGKCYNVKEYEFVKNKIKETGFITSEQASRLLNWTLHNSDNPDLAITILRETKNIWIKNDFIIDQKKEIPICEMKDIDLKCLRSN
jgi:hypothetical protein